MLLVYFALFFAFLLDFSVIVSLWSFLRLEFGGIPASLFFLLGPFFSFLFSGRPLSVFRVVGLVLICFGFLLFFVWFGCLYLINLLYLYLCVNVLLIIY